MSETPGKRFIHSKPSVVSIADGLFGTESGVGGADLPAHGQTTNQDAAPLGSGALLFIGFGAAYAMSKKSKK